jgi:hypothetical protein
MKVKEINLVTDFTRFPGGRLRIHGKWSGEEFREAILLPALREHERVIVNLNGAVGFPSSFLDEVFGGIVDSLGFEIVSSKLVIRLDDDPIAKVEIEDVMHAHRA